MIFLINLSIVVVKSQNEPGSIESESANGELVVAFDINNTFTDNESIFLITMDYNVGSCNDMAGLPVPLSLMVEYRLADNDVITVSKNFEFFSVNKTCTVIGWYPSLFTDSFIINPPLCDVSQPVVSITVSFQSSWSASECDAEFTYIFNGEVLGFTLGGETFSFEIEVEPSSIVSDLNFYILPNTGNPQPYHCGIGQTAYVAPFGGYPPYTITWFNIDGQIVDSYTTHLQYYDPTYGFLCSTPNETYISNAAENVFLNMYGVNASYTVEVEDCGGNSLSQPYVFSSGIENEVSFEYIIEQYIEGSNKLDLRLLLTPSSPEEGLLSFYPLSNQANNYEIWYCSLRNNTFTTCDYSRNVIDNDHIFFNLRTFDYHYPEGTYEISLYNSGVACETIVTQEFSCEELNLLCLTGDFFSCDNSATNLTLTSMYIELDISTIIWSGGQTGVNLEVPPAGGDYTVTVTDSNGNSTSKTFEVVIESVPIVDFGIEGIQICSGEMVSLNPQVSGAGGFTYLWDTGQTSATIAVNPTATTTYSVTVTDINGCSATNSITLTIHPLPTTPSITGDLILCIDEFTTLTASGGSSYLWSNGETSASITVNPIATTLYSVTVTDDIGCSASNSIIVTVNLWPSISITGDLILCEGESTTLTASGGINYVWQTGQTTPSITVSPTETTTYTVTGTDSNNCTATYTIAVTVNSLPTPSITGNIVLCEGESTTLTASGGNSYLWGAGQTSSSITVSPTETTTYSVTVTDTNGCTATDEVTLELFPQPEAQISVQENVCTVTLTANGGVSYLWNNERTDAEIEVSTPGIYSVTVTDTNGCTATASHNVLPEQIAPADVSGIYTVGEAGNNVPGVQLNGNIETWGTATDGHRIAGTIIIPAGKTMIINQTTLYMVGQNTHIAVLKGGILHIVDYAVLRGDNCTPPQHWLGIRIEADGAAHHPPFFEVSNEDLIHQGSPNHGLVYVSNNGSVKDALVAVKDYYTPTTLPPFDPLDGGGIIIIENQSLFENNLTHVEMYPFRPTTYTNVQRSRIENSFFRNNQPFVTAAYAEYQHQISINSVNRLSITGNQFLANTGTLSGHHKGTGIKTVNCGMNIGVTAGGASASNTFTGLYKAIDVYNTLTTVSVTNVKNNIFQNVNKALTLNGVPFAVVQNNNFEVPAGSDSPNDTYAVYGINSFGFLMTDNTFATSAPANEFTRAAVLNNTYFSESAIAQIRQNTFDGGFKDATRFEDDCRSLQLNCNVYLNEPQRDWYIADGARLDPQGICHPVFTELSFHQHWHYLPPAMYDGYNNRHVVNDNPNFTLELFHDDYQYSVPSHNEGNVESWSCSSELGASFGENPSCTIQVPPDNTGTEGCEYSGEELSKKIQDWQTYGETDSITALLHCIAEDWSFKLLVGTFIDRRMYPEALAALDSIPDVPQGNADFKTIYYAYIELLTGGSGKNSDASFVLHQVTLSQSDARQTMAESMLALLYGNDYVRSVKDIAVYRYINANPKKHFLLIPNPANEQVTIQFLQPVEDQDNIYLYDVTGRLIRTIATSNGATVQINTTNLYIGVYYLRLGTGNQVEKLVVIH